MQLVWDEFLKIMKAEAGSQIVETWFKAVNLEQWDPATKTVTLKMPNEFVSKWIRDHYLTLLKTHLGRLLHSTDLKLNLTCSQQDTEPEPPKPTHTILPASIVHYNPRNQGDDTRITAVGKAPHTNFAALKVTRKARPVTSSHLNDKYQFSSFIVGPSNSLAHAAAFAICKNLGKVYNPLFIYGGTGLGKTHLLHAIGNEVRRHNPGLHVRYETADRFINEFINCIRFDRSREFRSKYQKIDLLLIDDIQFLSNKEQTQEAFFHIFNSLHEKHKQIVFSSDTFPKDIKGLQGRLKSRMEWGLVADIQMPHLETKIAILKKKSDQHNIHLPDEVADYIASRVRSNIRELEGALVRVAAFADLTHQPITLEMAKRVLLTLNEQRNEDTSLEHVVKVVGKHYGVSPQEIKSKKRHKNIALARQISFFLMKKLTHSSLQTIGSFIGKRDHSTVIHALTKIDSLLKTDHSFEQKIKVIEQEILTD
ncbi:MAG: chromosomal replication initiator protein DnaA [Epsilonproteobacteria bacterium]|nr:chromosomal replication initiator protein DnaA [Campylobacterota bacterium]